MLLLLLLLLSNVVAIQVSYVIIILACHISRTVTGFYAQFAHSVSRILSARTLRACVICLMSGLSDIILRNIWSIEWWSI